MKREIPTKWFSTVCAALIESGAKTATKYLDPKTVVHATWRNKPSGRNSREEIVLTFGAPNYRDRRFIKKCLVAGEIFPVKKIQFIHYPTKKK